MEYGKRYQVFVSSTYVDLQEERQQVLETLMKMDCIPAGMELFPAADEQQFEFIKKVIDDCDYYLLIVGGKYGSLSKEGISYTEMEFDYAVEKGIRIVALLIEEPDKLAMDKNEIDPNLRAKLSQFREKVSKDRLVNYWKAADELPGKVSLSLISTIKMYPAVGWIRADQGDSTELLVQLNDLRQETDLRVQELQKLKEQLLTETGDYSSGDDTIMLSGNYREEGSMIPKSKTWSFPVSWNQIMATIGPCIFQHAPSLDKVEHRIIIRLARSILTQNSVSFDIDSCNVDNEDFETVKIQLIALGYIQFKSVRSNRGDFSIWELTPKGEKCLIDLRTIKKGSSSVLKEDA